MTLSDILGSKGTEVYTIVLGATLRRVTEILVERNCGSLVVVGEEGSRKMAGIITERDILRACSAGISLDSTLVDEAMTVEVITGSPQDRLDDAMRVITEKRVRHLPLVEAGELVGMISIGDLVKASTNQLSAENHYLKNYIHG